MEQESTYSPRHRLALTAGEPAGIGPDIILQIAQQKLNADVIALASPVLLESRASELNLPIDLAEFDPLIPLDNQAGRLYFINHELSETVHTGQVEPGNAGYVLECIKTAVTGCLSGQFAALVTAPVDKAIINQAGYPFSGHTEFIANLCGYSFPVMMLANEHLRVALVTTHLPLSKVPAAITSQNLERVIATVSTELRKKFGIKTPHLLICGLNPHAGEQGYLGKEEIEIINPVLNRLRELGLDLTGPCPADTAFTTSSLKNVDAVIAMYHDQGLPVLKAQGFGEIVNITLGLPIIRTSVDHGTALELAGTGQANANSMLTAIKYATRMANTNRQVATT